MGISHSTACIDAATIHPSLAEPVHLSQKIEILWIFFYFLCCCLFAPLMHIWMYVGMMTNWIIVDLPKLESKKAPLKCRNTGVFTPFLC